MRVLDIIEGTSVDGIGLRTSVYFAGCKHRCVGCHNESSWDFDQGEEMSVDDIMSIIDRNKFNVTFSGGDPMYSVSDILPLAKKIKERGYTIWCYTGFLYESLVSDEHKEFLSYIDVLVDGPFINSLRTSNAPWVGSSNQRVIDMNKTRKEGNVVLYKEA